MAELEFPTIEIEVPTTIIEIVNDEVILVLEAFQGPEGKQGVQGNSSDIITATASGPISGHRVVTYDSSGSFQYASAASAASARGFLGVTTSAASEGLQCTAKSFGLIVEPSWSWNDGPIFLGLEGYLTQVQPALPESAITLVIGYAVSPTSMFVKPQPLISLA